MKQTLTLTGLGCAHCAAKMETAIRRLPEVTGASINFMRQRLTLEAADECFQGALSAAEKIMRQIEPGARVAPVKVSGRLRLHLARIIASLALFACGVLLPVDSLPRTFMLLTAYCAVGWDVLWRAARNIIHGRVFDENFLMGVATAGAIALGDFGESAAVMIFYQAGEWFQDYAVGRSRRSIAQLMDIRPDHANLLLEDGSVSEQDPASIPVGASILIKPGERVPLDGLITEGSSELDTAALTGESAPRSVSVKDEIISGCINLSGVLRVSVKKSYGESTVARILELAEHSGARKAKSEQFVTRFARRYTPLVCAAAMALALLPPLITGGAFAPWIYRALTFLVISCPCALVISIPLSFFGGIGCASKAGILVKGGNYLEALAKTETVVFDKTGTLTQGYFEIIKTHPVGVSAGCLKETAALAEYYSDHPLARSIREHYSAPLDASRVSPAAESAGFGVRALVDGVTVLAGSARMMRENGITTPQTDEDGTVIHIARGGEYIGWLLAGDKPKQDAAAAIAALRRGGVSKTVMLTGDADVPGRKVAGKLGIDEVYTGLLPQDKVKKLEELLYLPQRKGSLVFVGDGINDAPVLARADVGAAMGALGSDAAIEAADVVIMTDEPSKLPLAISIGRRTTRIVRQNIVFALGVKGLALALGAFGIAGMWGAVFADVGVAVLAILNAMRALRTPV